MKYCLLAICFLYINSALANDSIKEVQSFGDGACWVEESEAGENLKIASFNDKSILVTTKDDLLIKLNNLLTRNQSKKINSYDEVYIHCGGYGASLVMKFEFDGRESCGWFYFKNGELKTRSLGGSEHSKKGNLCDGHVWGELIVGIKNSSQKKLIEDLFLKSGGESVIEIGTNLLKVNLKIDYFGKEIELMNLVKKNIDIKFVELNSYQHPVGESAPLN